MSGFGACSFSGVSNSSNISLGALILFQYISWRLDPLQLYGASGIELSERAQAKLERYEEQGFRNLPICMSKTPLSFRLCCLAGCFPTTLYPNGLFSFCCGVIVQEQFHLCASL